MKLNDDEKRKVLSSLESLLEKGESFNLTTTAIPSVLCSDVRNWVKEVVKLLTPYNKGKQGLNLDILEQECSFMSNIGEAFAELLPVVRSCIERIKNGTLDSWFFHLTSDETIGCVAYL